MRTISFRISNDVLLQLDRYAARKGLNRSEVIVNSITAFLSSGSDNGEKINDEIRHIREDLGHLIGLIGEHREDYSRDGLLREQRTILAVETVMALRAIVIKMAPDMKDNIKAGTSEFMNRIAGYSTSNSHSEGD